jgi:hypothetical protein
MSSEKGVYILLGKPRKIREYVLGTFAKKVGFSRANAKGLKSSLRHLERNKAIEVFQGGYKGHSLCHPKKVRVYDWDAVRIHFGLDQSKIVQNEISERKPRKVWKKPKPKKRFKIKIELKFCAAKNYCDRQVVKRRLPYPLCKEPSIFCSEQISKITEARVKF